MIRNIIVAILVLVLTGCQQIWPKQWAEKSELFAQKWDGLQRQDVKMLQQEHDICGLYGRYRTAHTMKVWTEQWDFLLWEPGQPNDLRVTAMARQIAVDLGKELTIRLRDFNSNGGLAGTECHHIEQWPGGASLGEDLDVRTLYATAKALNRLLNDERAIREQDGVASFHEVYREGIVEGAVARAPELKKAWLKAGQDRWVDSAAILYRFITEDRVPADRLGLDADQVAKLQRLHDSH